MVVGDIVTSNARLFPDKLGVIDEKVRLTWRQFNDRVNQLANALLGLGLKKGDRVAIAAENSHEYAEFFFAIAKAGLITVCLNYRLTTEQLTRILTDCKPRTFLVQEDVAAGLNPNATKKDKKRLESVGKPLFNGEMRVVDENEEDVAPRRFILGQGKNMIRLQLRLKNRIY